jgi:hypothetical protein
MGLALLALVFGLSALLACWIPVAGLVLALLAISVGMLTSSLGRAHGSGGVSSGLAIGAVVLGVVALVPSVVILAASASS